MLGKGLDLRILKGFSNLNDSVIPLCQELFRLFFKAKGFKISVLK